MTGETILSRLLAQLGVPHTPGYTDKRFREMPFQSLFGLTKLLQEYGVEGEAWQLDSPADIIHLTPPFLASTKGGFVIINSFSSDGKSINYDSRGVPEQISVADFLPAFNGVVYLASKTPASREPKYALHRRIDFFASAKKWVLMACAILLFLYLFISNGIYAHWSTVAIAVLDIFGLWITYMLVQKSLHFKNKAADHVCGILQAGGCDDILDMKVSKFFGLFGWSEVGFAYFSVSLLCLLMFPQYISYLAACNILCLPYTFWSIWYQKFRAKTWCTMCVAVQSTLWLLFFCYLLGGWDKGIFPLGIQFFILGITYVAVLLAVNALSPLITKDEN